MLKRIGAEEGGEFKAVASGTLPCGRPVIINADGTVTAVANVATSASAGTQVVFEAAQVPAASVVFDSSNNKVVVAYRDAGDSSKGKAIVGTVSGSTISFGTAVEFESGNTPYIRAVFDSSSNKVIIAYVDQDDSSTGKAIVGTVSGTSISFGTAVKFKNSTVGDTPGICFDSTNNKVVVFYRDGGNSNYGTAKVGTVSGTEISFSGASDVVFNSGNTRRIKSTFDTANGKTVTVFRDYGDSSKGKAIVGTVSGISISFGSEVEVTASIDSTGIAYDSNTGKTVVSFQDDGDNAKGKSRVGTVSGTSISFGTVATFDSGTNTLVDSTFDPTTNKVIIIFKDNSDNKGNFITGTVSGTDISFDSKVEFSASDANPFDVTYDTNAKKAIVVFDNPSGGNSGDATVITPSGNYPNLTSENYIGMSRGVAVQTGSASTTSSTSTFESATTSEIFSAYDTNSDRVVIAYRDNGNNDYGTAIVGTVSGSSISFGTPVVYHSNLSQDNTVVFDSSNNKIVISWKAWDASNNTNGTSIVGTVSGTAISFGSAVQFNTTSTADISSVFDSSNNKVVVSYRDASNSSHGTSRVGTVSGTSISFGSEVVFESAETRTITSVFDSNANKVVISYYDAGNSNYGTSIVGTVSGTSISFGSPVLFGGGTSSNHIESSFDTTANKVVISYVDVGDSEKAKAVVGTVSGTSISFGSSVLYNGTSTGDKNSIVYDSSANRHVIFFSDEGDSYKGKVVSGLVSGTSISFTDAELIADGSTAHLSATYDPDSSKVILSFDNVSNNYGVSVLHTPSTIATTRGEVASGQAASMDIIGSVSDNQIGLTAGQQYFVQNDGTIGTTAATPSVLAGTAISATELVVKT